MLKTLKAAAFACALLIFHVPQAQAKWQLMYGNDSIPVNATEFGLNGNLYSCRAYFEGGIHPGWTAPGKNACAFGWGGLEQDSYEYEIWVEDWEPATNGNVPANAIQLGYELSPGTSVPRPRYACQANDPDYQSWNPDAHVASGKVAPDLGGCDYAWDGWELRATSYNVLVDSAITMVDSTGGTKLPVAVSNLGTPPFISTYLPFWWSNGAQTNGTVKSGVDDDGQPLYFCTAGYGDGLHPGKASAGAGSCVISYGGQAIPNTNPYMQIEQNWQTNPQSNYCCGEIPIDQQIAPSSAQFPGGLWQSAVIGGNEADGSNLYLCAGWTANEPGWPAIYTPGKFSKSLGTCSVAQNGKEVLVTGYSLLVETYTKPAR